MFCEFCLAHPIVANKNGSFFIGTITVHVYIFCFSIIQFTLGVSRMILRKSEHLSADPA
jgi:hypothetical protein